MAYTKADLDQVNRDIVAAQAEVQYGDKRVKFRTLAELERIKGLIQSDLDAQARRRRPRMMRLRSAGKGV